MEKCRVCKTFVPLENRLALQALGRDLGVVHAQPCGNLVKLGVETVGRVALQAGLATLKKRAPATAKALTALRVVLAQRAGFPDEAAR